MPTYDIALIGGSGFVAGHLLKSFKRNGMSCLVLGRTKPQAVSETDFIHLDLEHQSIGDVLSGRADTRFKTLIFNSGIKARFPKDSSEWKVQGRITAPDFSGLRQFNRLITIGSSEEYGPYTDATEISETALANPVSSYGFWKLQLFSNGLSWAKQSGGQFIHLRPFNIIGPGADPKMLVGAAIRSLLENKIFRMTAGEQHRSFLSVSTLVKTVETLMNNPSWDGINQILNVSEPHYLKIKDMVQLLQIKIETGQVQFGEVPYRDDEVWHQNPSLTQLKKLLGNGYYKPLEATLDEMISSIRSEMKPS